MRRRLFLLLALTACQSQPKTPQLLEAPSLNVASAHYLGSPISGPTTQAAPTTVASGDLRLEVRWVGLAAMPDGPSLPLGSRARLIVAGNTTQPLRGSPGLSASARLVADPTARQLAAAWSAPRSATLAPIQQSTSIVMPGVTATFTGQSVDTTYTLRIAPGILAAGEAELHCAFEMLSSDPTRPSETVVFDQTVPNDDSTFALLVPMPSSPASPKRLEAAVSEPKVLGISVAIKPATNDASDADARQQCLIDLNTSAKSVAARPSLMPVDLSQSSGMSAALQSLNSESQRRSSLVYLSSQTEAKLCQQVSLVADNATLSDLAKRVDDATQTLSAPSVETLGWTLDHCAFDLLVSLADSPEGTKLPPELAAVLTQFTGEAGRHPSSLDDIAHGVSSEADLHNRVIAQNLVFLTDNSPASRVRAYDWLNSRHLAPAGFDPLGGGRQRREALDRASTSTTP